MNEFNGSSQDNRCHCMKSFIISAPGKVIVHGEHAVVYGKRALAASLDVRTFLYLKELPERIVTILLPDINVEAKWKVEELIFAFGSEKFDKDQISIPDEAVLQKYRKFLGLSENEGFTHKLSLIAFLHLYCSIVAHPCNWPSLSIQVSSNLPTSSGLGSSAAYSCCLSTAFLVLGKQIPLPSIENTDMSSWTEQKNLNLINQWAFQAEKLIHGNPSGIDNSVSTYGGALTFQAGEIKSLTSMPQLRILLTNTKVPRSTKTMVDRVRKRYNEYTVIIQAIITAIESMTLKFEEQLGLIKTNSCCNLQILGDLIFMNQYLLDALGVGHYAIDNVCLLSKKYNLPSKLTGAGGGGCVLTLLNENTSEETLNQLKADIESAGFDCWETIIGGAGVSLVSPKSLYLPKSFSVESHCVN